MTLRNTSSFIIVALAMLVATTQAWAGRKPKAPQFLKQGDKIAIISPGSTPTSSETPEVGARVLQEWGFATTIGQHAMARDHCYAGTIAQRKADLMQALRDPAVKAIMCTRGGYGSSLLLTQIPLDTLRRYPKWIIGYSDITALLSAEACAGTMGIHGGMCGSLSRGANDSINLIMRDLLMGKLPSYKLPGHPYNHPGTAKGILLGGNMAVFSNIAGSPYDFLDRDYIKGKDIILFFEDVSESIPRVNSMLTQLKLKGVIGKVKGIIIGRFTDYKPNAGYNDMNDMLRDYLAQYNIPICFDFPVSHDSTHNFPVIVGCPATLQVSKDQVTLDFDLNAKTR